MTKSSGLTSLPLHEQTFDIDALQTEHEMRFLPPCRLLLNGAGPYSLQLACAITQSLAENNLLVFMDEDADDGRQSCELSRSKKMPIAMNYRRDTTVGDLRMFAINREILVNELVKYLRINGHLEELQGTDEIWLSHIERTPVNEGEEEGSNPSQQPLYSYTFYLILRKVVGASRVEYVQQRLFIVGNVRYRAPVWNITLACFEPTTPFTVY